MRSREAVTVPVTSARSRPGTTARDGAAGGVPGGSPHLHPGFAVTASVLVLSDYLASERAT
jgi:hypothetical protein